MSGSAGNIYAPSSQNLQSANNQYGSLLGQNAAAVNNYAPSVSSSAQGLVNNYLSNPYATSAQTGANTASQYGTGSLAPTLASGAATLNGIGGQYAGDVNQALSTGFSSNNNLYNQQYQQTIDQANAINSMNGVASSPYGAGLVDQASQNFNNNWNINQANLQSQAANTASTLGGAATSAYNAGGALGTNAYNTYAGASSLPSQTYTGNLGSDLSALSSGNSAVSGATDTTNSVLSQVLNYLQYGTNATTSQQQQINSSNPGNILGSLLGLGTGGGSTVGGDALSWIGL